MDFSDLLKTHKWKIIIIILVITFGGMAAGAKYIQVVMTDEMYCLTCHAKERYVGLWKKSKIHPDIKCADCHGIAEELLKFDISANQEITDKNCIRCHKDVTKPDKKIHFEFNKMNILIPHKSHLDNDILCTDCHNNIRHEKRENGTYRPTMENCFHCHQEEESFCTQCHPHGSLELPHQTHVMETECNKCHHNYKDKEFTIYDTTFSHEPHKEGEIDCDECHSNVKKHGEIIRDREGCQECHDL